MTGVDALGLTILPDGRACSCGPAMGSRDPGCILHPLPERPEWVRLVTTLSDAPLGAHKVVGWNDGGAPIILADDDTTRIHLPRALWVPADPPEPSDPEEVCPEFTHTGYCPDRLCERGCKHEAAWKVGDRVEHTIHGIGEVIYYTPVLRDRPYCVRFDEGHHGWFEAGDIQEAPPVRTRPDDLSDYEDAWNAAYHSAIADGETFGAANRAALIAVLQLADVTTCAEAPPVSDTVMVELPLTWVQWQVDGMLYENDLPFDIEVAVAAACRSALTAEGER